MEVIINSFFLLYNNLFWFLLSQVLIISVLVFLCSLQTWLSHNFLTIYFFLIAFIGVTLVNKII